MKKYNCTIKEFRDITANDFDGKQYRIKIEVIQQEKINQPDEDHYQKIYQIDINCSGTLIATWNLNNSDLEKVICEYARRYFIEQFREGTIPESITLNLHTGNTTQDCPYDPDKIQCFIGKSWEIGERNTELI